MIGMFKLNRMTDYAIVVLGVLAHRQGEILATAQLAALTGLNQPTVAKVAKTLVAADLLDTQRGVHGGYHGTAGRDDLARADRRGNGRPNRGK